MLKSDEISPSIETITCMKTLKLVFWNTLWFPRNSRILVVFICLSSANPSGQSARHTGQISQSYRTNQPDLQDIASANPTGHSQLYRTNSQTYRTSHQPTLQDKTANSTGQTSQPNRTKQLFICLPYLLRWQVIISVLTIRFIVIPSSKTMPIKS